MVKYRFARFAFIYSAFTVPSACTEERTASQKLPTIRVAAAADLAFAFKEIGQAFQTKTQRSITFSFGSTGLLAKQISEGAPFDVFAAANVSFVNDAVSAGACFAETKALYGRGRLVAWTSKTSSITPPKDLGDLRSPRFKKIALANPEHAPYGRAARESLDALNLWDTLQPKIVFGENIQQTLQFARSANVEVALVALSLAISSQDGVYIPIDETLHSPLDQALVVCKHGSDAAGGREFAAFVSAPEGRRIMTRYGFVLPDDAKHQ